MSEDLEVESGPDRRSIMKAAAFVVVPVAGVGAVAACASSGGSSSKSASSVNGTVTVASSSVPVGGGFVDQNNNIVVTQPTTGQYKAFSAICTHQGCTVGGVTNNRIVCPCHGSVFSATDGSVINGPATRPLSPMDAALNGANVDVTSSAK
ncbi:Rieske (2Fe-2S) protein [Catenulispora sp. NF23]|uniref:Cytochrome bc1 complex Rieske iron-sulfur subunit n=1 Tax=Catenulispora pinistramenti TaxID=2705254 RepID=A0ABS5L070_9ACTN|nr:Rieske (2Fe-2S) protein [Catenulispora pinistramenti]MBS2536800.1 Rieske (2Fe-2S) protein [Catenulispora pinistramenti]MBS2551550.1 Rieske (2Fe-2S) protein [Catenulispora pinistramenti]